MEIELFSQSALFHIKLERVCLKYFVNGCTYEKFECSKVWNSYLLCRLFAHYFLAILCMLFQKNSKTGGGGGQGGEGVEDMQITGVGILKKWKSMRKSQGSIKKEVEFLGVINWSRKNCVEFPWVLVFGLAEISKPKKECSAILQNFLVWTLFSLEFTIFEGKVANLKIPRFFQKYRPVVNDCPCLDFFLE